jgi:hypothetical protein
VIAELRESSRLSRECRVRPADPASPDVATLALRAALDVYDQAFAAPSVYGLPSRAAIAAYRRIVSDYEPVIREKLKAAFLRRTQVGTMR